DIVGVGVNFFEWEGKAFQEARPVNLKILVFELALPLLVASATRRFSYGEGLDADLAGRRRSKRAHYGIKVHLDGARRLRRIGWEFYGTQRVVAHDGRLVIEAQIRRFLPLQDRGPIIIGGADGDFFRP